MQVYLLGLFSVGETDVGGDKVKFSAIFLLVTIPLLAIAQDGISPDTLYNCRSGVYRYVTPSGGDWCADTSAHDTSGFYGIYDTTGGGSVKWRNTEGGLFFDEEPLTTRTRATYSIPLDYYIMNRIFVIFDTREIPGLTSMKKIDSVFARFNLGGAVIGDGDSLFVVRFIPRQDSTPYAVDFSYDEMINEANFYQCSTETWVDGSSSHWGKWGVDLSAGWNSIKLDTSYISIGDTSGIGFATRINCSETPATWPTVDNYYAFACAFGQLDSACFQLVYYYSRKYNDISIQSADGISPDTIQFICSGELDEIATQGDWSAKSGSAGDWEDTVGRNYYWDIAFRGPDSVRKWPLIPIDTVWFDCWDCGLSGCGWHLSSYQPHVRASAVSNDTTVDSVYWFHVTRAYFIAELEEPIPDTTELDSMRFYCKFNYVHVDEGDSLFIVTYTPRDTNGVDCPIDYAGNWDSVLQHFAYPIIYGGYPQPATRWCNFYKCGDNYIWGEIPDRSYGRVPQYLGWTWFPIHPDIIDFHVASIGDTFGIGMILRDEHNPAPTDTNDISIGTGLDCPYIVYWFSKHEEEEVSGFINYGLRPPHLNWGLSTSQPRRMYGGSRRP